MSNSQRLKAFKHARSKHQLRTRPNERTITLNEKHPWVRLARWMNPSQQGWPWVGTGKSAKPVNFGTCSEAERIAGCLARQSNADLSILRDADGNHIGEPGGCTSFMDFVKFVNMLIGEKHIAGPSFARGMLFIAHTMMSVEQGTVKRPAALMHLLNNVGRPNDEVVQYLIKVGFIQTNQPELDLSGDLGTVELASVPPNESSPEVPAATTSEELAPVTAPE